MISRTHSIEDFKAKGAGGFNGIPFLGPWANRLDEQAFYANGQRYAFDMQLGNVRGAIPIHGLLTTTNQWQVIEVKADGKTRVGDEPARVLSRTRLWIKQFPFAHTIDMTYRLAGRRAPGDDEDRKPEHRSDAGGDRLPSVFSADRFQARGLDGFGRREVAVAAGAEQSADRRDRANREAVSGSARDSAEGLRSGSRLRRSRARGRWPSGDDAQGKGRRSSTCSSARTIDRS